MPKNVFSIKLLCSHVDFRHNFRTPFLRNTSGGCFINFLDNACTLTYVRYKCKIALHIVVFLWGYIWTKKKKKNRTVKEKVWNFQEKFILRKKESRSSHWRCSVKKSVLKNFENSQENTCARVSFSIVAGLRPANLLKKRIWQRCFSANFAKFLRTAFFIEHFRWLLLRIFHITQSIMR